MDGTAQRNHSVGCLYEYALARLGLTDTPEMRALFWDQHDALEWDEAADWYMPVGDDQFDCPACDGASSPAAGLSFGAALEALQAGHRVARAGWNGKGMWLAYTPGSEFAPELAKPGHAAAHRAKEAPNESIRLLPHIDMRAADGSMVIGWLASQTDMLANDWSVV